MKVEIYIEGGAIDSKELKIRCRRGFSQFVDKLGLEKMPSLNACGGRISAFNDFSNAYSRIGEDHIVLLWVDSEDLITDIEKTWDHLSSRDGWNQPEGTLDKSVLLMSTCMETWCVADRTALDAHYGHKLQKSALPSLANLETRDRHKLRDALEHATRNCSNQFQKGKRSFELLGKISPEAVSTVCPSANRCVNILRQRCGVK